MRLVPSCEKLTDLTVPVWALRMVDLPSLQSTSTPAHCEPHHAACHIASTIYASTNGHEYVYVVPNTSPAVQEHVSGWFRGVRSILQHSTTPSAVPAQPTDTNIPSKRRTATATITELITGCV
jgi:hypothetical protein